LEFQFSYNWSKSIDDGSGVTSGGENLPEGQRGMFFWDHARKRGLSAFDIRNSATANYSYQLPGENLKGMTHWFAGGWQLSGILTLTGGHPRTIGSSPTITKNAIGGNISGSAESNPANLTAGAKINPIVDEPSATYYYDPSAYLPADCLGFGPKYQGKSVQQVINESIAAGVSTPAICAPGDVEYRPGHFGNLGRNTLISPGLVNMDFSLQKNFNVKEGQKIQFRAEAFNLFNSVNLSDPGTSPYSSSDVPSQGGFGIPTTTCASNVCSTSGGQIGSSNGRPRTLQLGLKYTF
jgi:hypothetical protein